MYRKYEGGNNISPIIAFHLIKTLYLIGDLLKLKHTSVLRELALPYFNLLSCTSQFLVVLNLKQCVHNKAANMAMTEVGQRSYFLRIKAKGLQVKKNK